MPLRAQVKTFLTTETSQGRVLKFGQLRWRTKFLVKVEKGTVVFKNKEIAKVIQDNVEEIKTYGVKNIGIFGSFARAAANNKSDIDILVEFREGRKTFDNYMELKFFLEKLLHRKVDLVIKDALKPRIRQYVLKEVEYARL